MRFRRKQRDWHRLGWLLVVPAGAGLAAVAYAGRRRIWQAVAYVAAGVEEAADTVEDAAEDLRDAARARAAS